MARLAVKVTPNAKRSEVIGWIASGEAGGCGEALRIKLKAPPVDGKANKELIAFLAKTFGLPKTAVTIVRGEKSRVKSLEIAGLSEEAIREKAISP